MQVGAPGDIDKGFCIKCRTPLVIDIPEKIRFLCPDCVREVKALTRDAKSNQHLKRTVLEPGTWQQRLPDGAVKQLRDLKRRRKK